MRALLTAVILLIIYAQGMDKQPSKGKFKSFINKLIPYKKASNSTVNDPVKNERNALDLDFYELFINLPDELKLDLWHRYNGKGEYIHDKTSRKYIVPYSEYLSTEVIEKHLKRYKAFSFWDDNNFSRGSFRDYQRASANFVEEREKDTPVADQFPLNPDFGTGPNNKSNIKMYYKAGNFNYAKITDQHITYQPINAVDSKNKRYYCIHPDRNQFVIGYPFGLLTVDEDGVNNLITEYVGLSLPAEVSKESIIRFGPYSTVFINDKNDAIASYDYEKQRYNDHIDVEQLFNAYLKTNSTLHKKIYDYMNLAIHTRTRKKRKADCYFNSYTDQIDYLIHIADFIFPTSESEYLIIKFQTKLPFCTCKYIVPDQNYFILYHLDHFALYNVTRRNFFYLGFKHDKSFLTESNSKKLPNFKSIKKGKFYRYVYDFANYQSQGLSHMFCYDDELNCGMGENKSPSRRTVAIVPDDDIARLEQMILAAVAKGWCNKKESSRDTGFKILRYLIDASLLLREDQNPFKQKRLSLLKALTHEVADKLSIDLAYHLKYHLQY